MDGVWIAVITAGVTALGAGLPAVGSSVVQGLSQRGQRKHDAELAKETRKAQLEDTREQRAHEEKAARRRIAEDLLPQRQRVIAEWREKLRESQLDYREWTNQVGVRGRLEAIRPNLVGQKWFEEVRSQMPADWVYNDVATVDCTTDVVLELSTAIGQVERRWIAEAQGN